MTPVQKPVQNPEPVKNRPQAQKAKPAPNQKPVQDPKQARNRKPVQDPKQAPSPKKVQSPKPAQKAQPAQKPEPARSPTKPAETPARALKPAYDPKPAHRTAPAPAPAPARQRPARDRSGLTWNALGRSPAELAVETDWPAHVTPQWAWGGASGRGVRVCVVDSGVEGDHPDVGPLQGSYAVMADAAGELRVEEVPHGDTCGHGTACAGVVRALAPECELYSVRVLGERYSSSGDVFLTGLRWAVAQGYDVVSVSLSTTRGRFAEALHAIADEAFFRGTVLVCSAHNTPVESYPWRFASVVSVGSHAVRDPELLLYNPDPPVEFFAHGTDVEVAWLGGTRTRVTGNSFATPHVAGYCALALSKHPRLTPFQVKSLLHLLCDNVRTTA